MSYYLLSIVLLCYSSRHIHSQVVFESFCTTDVRAAGLPTVDGNDEFEIDLYETKFLPDSTIYCERRESILV
jgi:hypothetical protein